ncbi:hypothetical protein EHP00_1208 [Ecytonucleospora hepatopenaei]|uniref:Uncharacterized protein n=1 Tax=Ecytonucleospora hepatopenaei TaxID=646526 RepID=A0A1W0E7Z3_9MICR|nr:hypothetical protein EHP00_1208 [Ecytonucleospora hepatopenaei]
MLMFLYFFSLKASNQEFNNLHSENTSNTVNTMQYNENTNKILNNQKSASLNDENYFDVIKDVFDNNKSHVIEFTSNFLNGINYTMKVFEEKEKNRRFFDNFSEESPNVETFACGARTWTCSCIKKTIKTLENIKFSMVKTEKPVDFTEIFSGKGGMKFSSYFFKSLIKKTQCQKLEVYLNLLVHCITELSCTSHFLHEFIISHYISMDTKSLSELFTMEYFANCLLMHFIEGTMVLMDFDRIFEKHTYLFRIILTQNYKRCNAFAKLKSYFNFSGDLFGLINYLPFEEYQSKNEDLDLIYKEYTRMSSKKKYDISASTLSNFYKKHKHPCINIDANDILEYKGMIRTKYIVKRANSLISCFIIKSKMEEMSHTE